jgi:hypothetical protein
MYGQPPETILDLRTGHAANLTDSAALAQTVLALFPVPGELAE